MESKPDAKTIRMYKPMLRIAVAAGIALLAGLSALVQFYTKTIEVPAGQHAEIYLPDNSMVKLNAHSELSYKPLLWKFSRSLKFEGEAFFDVMKGKQFEVISGKGKTVVLGTTFNIYSRNNDYQVTCISGKVKVVEKRGRQEAILNPGDQADLNEEGGLIVKIESDTEQILSWLDNKLSFTSAPLSKVLEEIGRQYNVLIDTRPEIDYIYTGTFSKESSVENVLNLVCRPFDLKITRKSDNEYTITGNNQKAIN